MLAYCTLSSFSNAGFRILLRHLQCCGAGFFYWLRAFGIPPAPTVVNSLYSFIIDVKKNKFQSQAPAKKALLASPAPLSTAYCIGQCYGAIAASFGWSRKDRWLQLNRFIYRVNKYVPVPFKSKL